MKIGIAVRQSLFTCVIGNFVPDYLFIFLLKSGIFSEAEGFG